MGRRCDTGDMCLALLCSMGDGNEGVLKHEKTRRDDTILLFIATRVDKGGQIMGLVEDLDGDDGFGAGTRICRNSFAPTSLREREGGM